MRATVAEAEFRVDQKRIRGRRAGVVCGEWKVIRKIEWAVLIVGAIAIVISVHGWMQNRSNRQTLQTLLDEKQKAIDSATASENKSEAALAKTIADIESLRRRTRTPEQAAKALTNELSRLPVPIKVESLSAVPARSSSSAVTAREAASPTLIRQSADGARRQDLDRTAPVQVPAVVYVPAADIKPLFDSVEGCKECEARLVATLSQIEAEKAKSDALEKQRDVAVAAARGGSGWMRFRRAAKWIAIGALAGAALSHRL